MPVLCHLPPPKLSIAEPQTSGSSTENGVPQIPMDCSPEHDPEDVEHASICDTASVASDLTRMCVSDEEDKIIFDNDNT